MSVCFSNFFTSLKTNLFYVELVEPVTHVTKVYKKVISYKCCEWLLILNETFEGTMDFSQIPSNKIHTNVSFFHTPKNCIIWASSFTWVLRALALMFSVLVQEEIFQFIACGLLFLHLRSELTNKQLAFF